jgi:2-haloacid dehalogenase
MKPWPDAIPMLKKIKAAGLRVITIANFSHEMLRANARNAGIENYFDELLSTEVNKTYKPDARAYELGRKRLGLKKEEIVFAAFGGWDAFGAKSFGYPTVWVNRFQLPAEKVEQTPDAVVSGADDLLRYLGIRQSSAMRPGDYKNKLSSL